MIYLSHREARPLPTKRVKTMNTNTIEVTLENVERLLKEQEEMLAEIAEMIRKLKQP